MYVNANKEHTIATHKNTWFTVLIWHTNDEKIELQ